MAFYTLPDSYTKLLIHADELNGVTTFIDSSDSPHTITRSGTPDHDSGNKVFGRSGIYIPKGHRILMADSTDWQFGTGDFTIDFWSKGWSTTDTRGLFTYFKDASNRYHLTNYSNLEFYCNRAGSSQNLTFVNTRDLLWHHYAVVLSGTTLRIYVDGVKKGENTSFTQNIDFTGGTFLIGARTDNGSDFTTYSAITSIDEFRVSKGIARWNSNFIPPSKPYNKIDDDYEASVAKEDSAFGVTGGGNVQFGSNIVIRSDPDEPTSVALFSVNQKDGTELVSVNPKGNNNEATLQSGLLKVDSVGSVHVQNDEQAGIYMASFFGDFDADEVKTIQMKTASHNVFGSMYINVTGNYGNTNAIGAYEVCFSVGVNSVNTGIYSAGSTTILNLGGTSAHFAFGTPTKPDAVTYNISATNRSSSYAIPFYFNVVFKGYTRGISSIGLV